MCVCVCVCVCVCLCVFMHDNAKRNQSRNTKFESILVYKNSSDEFAIGPLQIKVKVTVGVQSFPIYHNTNCKVLYFNFGKS